LTFVLTYKPVWISNAKHFSIYKKNYVWIKNIYSHDLTYTQWGEHEKVKIFVKTEGETNSSNGHWFIWLQSQNALKLIKCFGYCILKWGHILKWGRIPQTITFFKRLILVYKVDKNHLYVYTCPFVFIHNNYISQSIAIIVSNKISSSQHCTRGTNSWHSCLSWHSWHSWQNFLFYL
jgi:hypothetical protein